MTRSCPIYLFPGISVEYPIFDRIVPLLTTVSSIVAYPEPMRNEPLTHFAGRIAAQLPSDCFVAGTSFGGIVALEVARIVKARACFLIGSIRGPDQLPPWLRMWRLLGREHCDRLLRMAGNLAAAVPRCVRISSTVRLKKLSGSAGSWHRWAITSVLTWRPRPDASVPIVQIHGDADTTFPICYVTPDIVVRHGKHALCMSHPQDVADAINAFIMRYPHGAS